MRQDTNLALMQEAFGEALLGESPQAALQWIEGGDGLAKERLFVYRRNCLSSLIDCLKGRYPRIREALGGARFDALAQEFVLAHPPDDEALSHYGVGFAELLRAGVEPWLADLALLELYWHQSYHERDMPPLAAAALSEVPPEKLDSLAFECHPTVRSLASEWDLLVPWEHPLEKAPRLACDLLVVRVGNAPSLYRLESRFRDFFRSLRDGVSTARAFELASGEKEFSQWLATLLSWGVFSRFRFVEV